MNILIIVSWLFDKNSKTSGSFFVEQAEALSKQGNKVYLLYVDTFSVPHICDYFSYKEKTDFVKNGVQYHRAKKISLLKRNSGIKGNADVFSAGIVELFNKHLKNSKIDIIHAHGCMWAGYAAYKLKKIYNIPYLITEHSTNFKLNQHLLVGDVKKKISICMNYADQLIAVGDGLKTLMQGYTSHPVDILGNVVDCELFKVKKSDTIVPYTFFTLAYMETPMQIHKKGLDILVEAFADLIKYKENVRLVIGGGGTSDYILKNKCVELGIEKYVQFVGKLSRQEAAEYMQKCNSFVLPSRYETFGVVYAEAMACGKPVIATKTGGPDHFIKEFNGILIEIEDRQQLVESMLKIIDQSGMYREEIISDYIKDNFSSIQISNNLINRYRRIIGGKSELS